MANNSLRKAEGRNYLELRTSAGALIASELTTEGFVQFELTNLSKGIYLVIITDQYGQKQVERLIVR